MVSVPAAEDDGIGGAVLTVPCVVGRGESSASSSSACRRTSTGDSSARRRSTQSLTSPAGPRPDDSVRLRLPSGLVAVSSWYPCHPPRPGAGARCRPSSRPLPRAPAIRSRGPSRPQGRSARVALHGTWFRPTVRHARPQFGQRANATRPQRGSQFGRPAPLRCHTWERANLRVPESREWVTPSGAVTREVPQPRESSLRCTHDGPSAASAARSNRLYRRLPIR